MVFFPLLLCFVNPVKHSGWIHAAHYKTPRIWQSSANRNLSKIYNSTYRRLSIPQMPEPEQQALHRRKLADIFNCFKRQRRVVGDQTVCALWAFTCPTCSVKCLPKGNLTGMNSLLNLFHRGGEKSV